MFVNLPRRRVRRRCALARQLPVATHHERPSPIIQEERDFFSAWPEAAPATTGPQEPVRGELTPEAAGRLSGIMPPTHGPSPRRLGMAGFCAVVAIVLAAPAGASREIPLVREGGVYEVPVTINGWLERPFILDSGASDVQVSADVFLTLYPRGGPAPRFLPGVSYRLADGQQVVVDT
jgi:hypothetical protein